jgi:hypothetical protein
MLSHVYGAAPEKVYIIHHGVPAFREQDRKLLKQEYGFEERELITTFGLIGPGKGIEIGIRALKRLVLKYKNLMYLIVGKTHPMLVGHEGEQHGDHYRESLIELVRRLGMQNHVEFVNKFLEPEELGEYLQMTDVYLSPYPNLNQAISGTLAYALGWEEQLSPLRISMPWKCCRKAKEGWWQLMPPPRLLLNCSTASYRNQISNLNLKVEQPCWVQKLSGRPLPNNMQTWPRVFLNPRWPSHHRVSSRTSGLTDCGSMRPILTYRKES